MKLNGLLETGPCPAEDSDASRRLQKLLLVRLVGTQHKTPLELSCTRAQNLHHTPRSLHMNNMTRCSREEQTNIDISRDQGASARS